MFRTWTIRQGNTVWVCKLIEIVISLWLEIIKLDKEWFNVILLYGTIFETNIWNKWKSESVNRSLTLINQLLLWKKKGTKLDTKRKISKSSVLHWLYFWYIWLPCAGFVVYVRPRHLPLMHSVYWYILLFQTKFSWYFLAIMQLK